MKQVNALVFVSCVETESLQGPTRRVKSNRIVPSCLLGIANNEHHLCLRTGCVAVVQHLLLVWNFPVEDFAHVAVTARNSDLEVEFSQLCDRACFCTKCRYSEKVQAIHVR